MIPLRFNRREIPMPRSMTGFARQEAQFPWGSISCEIRTVNHRYLEPSLRMPEVLRVLEPRLREVLKKSLSRGKIEISLQLNLTEGENAEVGVNEALAHQIIQAAEKISASMSQAAPISPVEILKWPGVIQSNEINAEEIQGEAVKLFSAALEQLVSTRQREGEELGQFIDQRLQSIIEKVVLVRAQVPEIQHQFQEKLRSKLEALKVEVEAERFHQEVAYMAQKSDVAEELDRLDAHVNEVRHTLKQKNPIGRRLDFLMQELNREANTLSSKSMTSETSQIAVDLKVLIEQMREQVQNIE